MNNNLKMIYSYIDNINQAANLFTKYCHISLTETGEVDTVFGWEPPLDNKMTFNEACEDLIELYNNISVNDYEYADEKFIFFEDMILMIPDKESKLVFIKRIIREMYVLIVDGWQLINSSFQENINHCCDEDNYQMSEGLSSVSFFIESGSRFLYRIGDICNDFKINIKDLCIDEFSYTEKSLNLNLFDVNIKEERKQSLLTNYNKIKDIYNLCNSRQWESISLQEFNEVINSGGRTKSIIIIKNEINRTKCIFNMIKEYIEPHKSKEWVESIKKNIFGNTDFTKATLRTNILNSGYSPVDVDFLDSINKI